MSSEPLASRSSRSVVVYSLIKQHLLDRVEKRALNLSIKYCYYLGVTVKYLCSLFGNG